MDDYYSLLGIDADASVDDIRGAYRIRKDGLDTAGDAGRADAAKLNKAWNVLSDPYQRGRYDEQRASAEERGDLGVDDDTVTSNGSSVVKASSGAGSSRQERQQRVRDARAAKMKNAQTLSPPPGTHWPDTKNRIFAMLIDLLVLVILVSGSQVIAQSVAKSQKPDVVHTVDRLNNDITQANKDKSAADKLVSADKKANNTSKQSVDQKTSDTLKKKVSDLTKQRDDAVAKLNPYFIVAIAIAFFLGFLYLAIPTALTGRTLGKRLQHLKVLREDGSPLGVRGGVVRFGGIVLVTFVLYYVLQQIAAIIVLFGVTMWMRNPNMQGLHDRFAHTIVVSDAAPKAD
ncbi:MAG TPA: RDD family protein [Acidimicrobiia bacterium]|nr:RDD family protein [Acidimicrobiia bacterium]